MEFSDNPKSSQELLEELYEPVEEGDYLLVISDAEIKPNKDSQKSPSLKVTFKYVEDANDKKTLWKWFYLDKSNQISMAQIREFLEAVYDTELRGNVTLDPQDLHGRHVIGTVTQEPWNDGSLKSDGTPKMQNVVNIFTPAA